MIKLTGEEVIKSILKWPGRYEDTSGRVFLGMPVSQVPSQLIQTGWKNVSRLDRSDFEKLGLGIVEARYVGGVRPKKFCWVVVAGEAPVKKRWSAEEEIEKMETEQ